MSKDRRVSFYLAIVGAALFLFWAGFFLSIDPSIRDVSELEAEGFFLSIVAGISFWAAIVLLIASAVTFVRSFL
jgi:hypothetical protein